MKRLIAITALMIGSCSTLLYTQETGNKHYFDYGFGTEMKLSSVTLDETTLAFPPMNKNSLAFAFRYSFFPHKNFGFYCQTQFSFPGYENPEKNRIVNFTPEASQLQQPVAYYVLNEPDYQDESGVNVNFVFGLSYRWETNKVSLRPYLGLGITDMETINNKIDLKGVGNNMVYRVKYFTRDRYNNQTVFFINPGISFNYKITRKLQLLFDINYTQNIKKGAIFMDITDMYTHETERKLLASKREQYLNIKLGISHAIRFPGKRKKKNDFYRNPETIRQVL